PAAARHQGAARAALEEPETFRTRQRPDPPDDREGPEGPPDARRYRPGHHPRPQRPVPQEVVRKTPRTHTSAAGGAGWSWAYFFSTFARARWIASLTAAVDFFPTSFSIGDFSGFSRDGSQSTTAGNEVTPHFFASSPSLRAGSRTNSHRSWNLTID